MDAPRRLRQELLGVERLALRGNADGALDRLASVHAEEVDQRMAVAEHAVLVERLGGHWQGARDICDRTLDQVEDPAARGALLINRARVSRGTDRRRAYTTALTECSVAGDERGTALALGWLAFPYEDDDGLSMDYRARLGREGLDLAMRLDDPHVIAVCAGNLAACETMLGRPSAYALYHRSVDLPAAAVDTPTSLIVSRNYVNWTLTALGRGDYAQADRVAAEGSVVARGRASERLFAAVEGLVAMRRGDLAAAGEAAARARTGDQDRAAGTGQLVESFRALHQDSRLEVTDLLPWVEPLVAASEQVGAIALSVLAQLRLARREPRPERGLRAALDRVRARGRRFGWEDLVVALAEIHPAKIGEVLEGLGDLWPAGPRPEVVRAFLRARAAGSYEGLVAAAEGFEALPEPLSAARARHLAAGCAANSSARNRQLARALELYQACQADRGVAAVLREGRLRRSPQLPTIPASQRNVVHAGLTPREHEVATLARQGLTAGEIAERLSIAEGTVRNHLLRARQKFGGIPKHRFGEIFGED